MKSSARPCSRRPRSSSRPRAGGLPRSRRSQASASPRPPSEKRPTSCRGFPRRWGTERSFPSHRGPAPRPCRARARARARRAPKGSRRPRASSACAFVEIDAKSASLGTEKRRRRRACRRDGSPARRREKRRWRDLRRELGRREASGGSSTETSGYFRDTSTYHPRTSFSRARRAAPGCGGEANRWRSDPSRVAPKTGARCSRPIPGEPRGPEPAA